MRNGHFDMIGRAYLGMIRRAYLDKLDKREVIRRAHLYGPDEREVIGRARIITINLSSVIPTLSKHL